MPGSRGNPSCVRTTSDKGSICAAEYQRTCSATDAGIDASQIRAVLSAKAAATRDPSGEKALQEIPPPSPAMTTSSWLPVCASQIRADALLLVNMREPSGENEAEVSVSKGPENNICCSPVCASQVRAVRS